DDGNGGGNGGPDSGQGCGLVTCDSAHATCGPIGDGCGGVLHCGTCTLPETCGGGATPSQCGGHSGCTPKTCMELGATCGAIGDGCGNLLHCGSCTAARDTCGGGGLPNTCGHPTPAPDSGLPPCMPRTCASVGAICGPVGDGCGNLLQCGSCTIAGDTCGGAGARGQCGRPNVPDAGPEGVA